jgi:hypothetical protein
MMKRIAKTLLIACGTLCVGLALLGLLLPVLPTTPFLLLAAFCYARSSRRFYDWLVTNRWFGDYIRNYREGRGISLRQKVISISLLWLTIGYAAGFVIPPLWGKISLGVIAAAVTVHLLTVKTCRPERKTAVPAGCGRPGGSGSPVAPDGRQGAPSAPPTAPSPAAVPRQSHCPERVGE